MLGDVSHFGTEGALHELPIRNAKRAGDFARQVLQVLGGGKRFHFPERFHHLFVAFLSSHCFFLWRTNLATGTSLGLSTVNCGQVFLVVGMMPKHTAASLQLLELCG